ncbi:MAG: ribosome-binding factor A [Candidatus Falkowbacteria bacterium]
MSRIIQINELLKGELANLIREEIVLNNGLVTVCYVDCSPDLKSAKVGISVLPYNLSGKILAKLKKHSSQFCKTLKKKLNLRCIPRFNWIIDSTERDALELEKIMKKLNNEL